MNWDWRDLALNARIKMAADRSVRELCAVLEATREEELRYVPEEPLSLLLRQEYNEGISELRRREYWKLAHHYAERREPEGMLPHGVDSYR